MDTEQEYTLAEVSVGLITLIVSVLVIATGVWMEWIPLRSGGYIVYADFSSASGLTIGDPVEIAGVKVGAVESVQLAEDHARVTLRMDPSVKLRENAVARMQPHWLIGDRTINIEPGDSGGTIGHGAVIENTQAMPTIPDLVSGLIAGDLVSRQ